LRWTSVCFDFYTTQHTFDTSAADLDTDGDEQYHLAENARTLAFISELGRVGRVEKTTSTELECGLSWAKYRESLGVIEGEEPTRLVPVAGPLSTSPVPCVGERYNSPPFNSYNSLLLELLKYIISSTIALEWIIYPV
jgi:hypothetical protein